LANHKSFMSSMNILFIEEFDDFSSLYWNPKLHKNPYRERYTAGVSTFSTQELFINMDNILSAVTWRLQSYYDKVYWHNSFNQMWILKYCKDILDHFNSRSLSKIAPVQTFDFSTPYKPFLVKIYKHV